MFKAIRVYIGLLAGLWVTQYFLDGFDVNGLVTYLIAAAILLAITFIVRGFRV
jgi:uncharacterized membrane protein YvlD (DUF360 family)